MKRARVEPLYTYTYLKPLASSGFQSLSDFNMKFLNNLLINSKLFYSRFTVRLIFISLQ